MLTQYCHDIISLHDKQSCPVGTRIEFFANVPIKSYLQQLDHPQVACGVKQRPKTTNFW